MGEGAETFLTAHLERRTEMSKGLPRSLKNANRAQSTSLEIIRVAMGSPAAVSATAVHAAIAQTDAEQDITADITNPDVPRNVTIKGNASGNAGDVVITGTNRDGAVITETIALSGSSEVVGNKAFATVTNIHLPAEVHAGTDTVSIGRGAKLGLPYKFSLDPVIQAYLNGAREATRPTVVVSASALESNTVLLSSSLAGTAVVVDLYR